MTAGMEMTSTKVLMELEALAEKLGIQVIHERLSRSKSGLCRLHDQYMLFLERNLKEDDKVEVLLASLSRFSLDDTQMLPGIREMLEEHRYAEEAVDYGEEEYMA
ncbi:MAG: hypothetical protein JSV47_13035 [Deltaproteobacteria bacterium]|jgi:hypothetical protein|nr:MAG: hypothetical protein JSV47_13035 [Deltaproteobacteria bacterium]